MEAALLGVHWFYVSEHNTRVGSAFRLGQSIASLASRTERRQRAVRVVRASVMMVLVLATGTFGFNTLTEGEYSPLTCLYMTVLTVSTVGFHEIVPIASDALKLFTIGLILFGGGSILYFLTSVTAVVVEGDLLYRFWRQRMMRRLERLDNHIIVAGLDSTGLRALEELWAAGVPLVVVEEDAERIELGVQLFGEDLLFIVGDVLGEEVLSAAGIETARAVVASLPHDHENLFLCVTARQLNPEIHIAARVGDPANAEKFLRVGANDIVNPARRGGRRIAIELARPGWLAFTDAVLASRADRCAMLPVSIRAESRLVGKRLSEAGLEQRTGCLIMGIRSGDQGPFSYHPDVDTVLSIGCTIVALGDRRELRRLHRLSKGRIPRDTVSPPRRRPVPEPADRIVIVGGGTVGGHVVSELQALGLRDLVVIDVDQDRLDALVGAGTGVRTVCGEARDDHTLRQAGVQHAVGLITSLPSDRDNLFISLSARQLNPKISIVSRIEDTTNRAKFMTVGTNEVVSIDTRGGQRLAHAILHRELAAFADALLASEARPVLMAQLTVAAESPVAGLRLVAAALELRTRCVILGFQARRGRTYLYRPEGNVRLRANGSVLALGEDAELEALAALLQDPAALRPDGREDPPVESANAVTPPADPEGQARADVEAGKSAGRGVFRIVK